MDSGEHANFKPRAAVPALAADEVHVWSMQVDPALRAREISATAQSALLRFLSIYANCAVTPTIERGAHGKPFAPGLPDLHFNLSHARHRLLFAFARGQALGVDLEHVDRRLSVEDLATRFFAPAEARVIAGTPDPVRQHEVFLRLWTHKEAVLKALGQGLRFGLDRVEFSFDRDHDVASLQNIAEEAGAPSDWRVQRCDPDPGWFGAVAWRGGARRLRCFAWAP